MTHEELIEAQLSLGKAATNTVLEVLQGEGNKVVVQVSYFFEDETADNWKMVLEILDK